MTSSTTYLPFPTSAPEIDDSVKRFGGRLLNDDDFCFDVLASEKWNPNADEQATTGTRCTLRHSEFQTATISLAGFRIVREAGPGDVCTSCFCAWRTKFLTDGTNTLRWGPSRTFLPATRTDCGFAARSASSMARACFSCNVTPQPEIIRCSGADFLLAIDSARFLSNELAASAELLRTVVETQSEAPFAFRLPGSWRVYQLPRAESSRRAFEATNWHGEQPVGRATASVTCGEFGTNAEAVLRARLRSTSANFGTAG